MPVGEAICGVTGNYICSSTPNIYEYAGVFIWVLTHLISSSLSLSVCVCVCVCVYVREAPHNHQIKVH